MQSFLFFSHVQEDGARAMELCDLLGTRIVDGWEIVWVPVVAGGMGNAREEARKRWRWQVKKVLEMAVVMVGECSG